MSILPVLLATAASLKPATAAHGAAITGSGSFDELLPAGSAQYLYEETGAGLGSNYSFSMIAGALEDHRVTPGG